MPIGMVGVEIEARTLEDRDVHHHPHVAVVPRPGPGSPVPSLVFAALREGRYALVPKEGGPAALTASVHGGAVTEVSWS
jgi:hypothetical protein